MKRKMMRLLAAIIALFCFATVFNGCVSKKVQDDDQHLEMYVLNVGFGYEWAIRLADEFGKQDWVKEKYPNFSYSYKQNDNWDFAKNRIESGPTVNTADILFGSNLQKLYNTSYKGELVLSDLDAIMQEKVTGEDIVYKDKIFPDYLTTNLNPETGKAVAVPWSGPYSTLLYNQTLFSALGFDALPATSDELTRILNDIKVKDGAQPYPYSYGLIGCSEVNYWKNAYMLWWAQYQGLEEYKNFYNGVSEGKISRDIFSQVGRKKSLEAMESILDGHKGYMDPSIGVYTHMEAQTNFLMGKGVFYMSGDWFDYEMRAIAPGLKEVYDYNMRAMRMPVISSIREKTPSILNDAMLSAVIRAVDNGETAYQGVSATDFAKIKAARGLTDFGGGNLNTVVPSYATANALAKDFVRYMATDEANRLYAEVTKGGNMGFEYDLKNKAPDVYKNISLMEQDKYDVLNRNDVTFLPLIDNFPLVYKGGLLPLKAIEYNSYENVFGRTDDGHKTARDLFEYDKEYYNGNRWNLLLSLSGL